MVGEMMGDWESEVRSADLWILIRDSHPDYIYAALPGSWREEAAWNVAVLVMPEFTIPLLKQQGFYLKHVEVEY